MILESVTYLIGVESVDNQGEQLIDLSLHKKH